MAGCGFHRGNPKKGCRLCERRECINPHCTAPVESGFGKDQVCHFHKDFESAIREEWFKNCDWDEEAQLATKKPWYFNKQVDLYKVPPRKIEYHLTESQGERLVRFWNHHTNLHGMYDGAIGGRFSWVLTNTSLGTVIKSKCSCGDICDVSDYEDW